MGGVRSGDPEGESLLRQLPTHSPTPSQLLSGCCTPGKARWVLEGLLYWTLGKAAADLRLPLPAWGLRHLGSVSGKR